MALVKDNEREELAAAYACFLLHDAGVEVSVCASSSSFSPPSPFSFLPVSCRRFPLSLLDRLPVPCHPFPAPPRTTPQRSFSPAPSAPFHRLTTSAS